MSYTSINGYKVKRSKKRRRTDREYIDSLLQDPITMETIKLPVVLNCSGNMYDRTSLYKWFRESDIDPLCGTQLEQGKINYSPCFNLFALALTIEEVNDEYIFHAPRSSFATLMEIARHVYKGCTRKTHYRMFDVDGTKEYRVCKASDEVSLDYQDYLYKVCEPQDILYPDNIVWRIDAEDVPVEDNYLTISDIVSTCAITLRSFGNKLRLISEGSFVNADFDLDTIGYAISMYNFQNSHDVIPFNLKDTLKLQVFGNDVTIDKTLNLSDSISFVMKAPDSYNLVRGGYEVTSMEKKLYQYSLEHFNNMVLNKDYVKSIKFLNKYIEDNFHLLDKFAVRTIDKLRENLGVPLPVGSCSYGYDLSLLEIKDKTFLNLKKFWSMVGSTLINVTFKNADIMYLRMINVRCTNVVFEKCSFNECNFYKQKMDGITFKDCKFDDITEKIMQR